MHLEKFTIKDIIFIAIIAAGYTISGFVAVPLIIGSGIYGSPFVVMAIFYAFFTVILLLKVRKPGCVILAALLNGLVLAMMSVVMLFMIVGGALLAELITLLIFRSYEKKAALITAGSLLMPLAFPVGVTTNMLILGGSFDDIIGGGGGTWINLLCFLGTIVMAVVGSFIGWKVGSELKKAGKLK